MRWKWINDVAEDKRDTVYEAMNFYSNLKSKDYSLIVIDELEKNLWMIQEEDQMFVVLPENDHVGICPMAFHEMLELSMANAIIRLNDTFSEEDIKKGKSVNNKMLGIRIQDIYLSPEYGEKGNHYHPLFSDRNFLKSCLWNIDDERMAIQASVKAVIAAVLSFEYEHNQHQDLEDEAPAVSMYYSNLMDLKSRMEQSSIPSRRDDIEDIDEESLDLISSAMFNEDEGYIETVLDYILK